MKNEMRTYVDEGTGYEIRQYTSGPEKNTKLYFTTENFTVDDQYFFFNKEVGEKENELYRAHVESGEYERMADSTYTGFAMDRFENYGVMTKGDVVCRLDCDDKTITEIGALPKGGRITGHLTTSKDGTIVCSYKLASCIYALVVMDPHTEKARWYSAAIILWAIPRFAPPIPIRFFSSMKPAATLSKGCGCLIENPVSPGLTMWSRKGSGSPTRSGRPTEKI